MIFERKKYLDELIAGRGNGLVKIITGVRRCGKSFLLFTRKCFCRIGLTTALQSFSYSNKKTHKYNLLFGGFMRYFGHCVKLCKSKTI